MKPETMTVDECVRFVFDRTWVRPFTKENPSSGWMRRDGKPDGLTWGHDPEIEHTLDAAAAAMPEGLHIQLTQHSDGWYAVVRWPHKFSGISIEQADTELLARWRLVVACMMAEKEVGDEFSKPQ